QRRLRIDIDVVGLSVHRKTRQGSLPTEIQNGASISGRLVQKKGARHSRGGTQSCSTAAAFAGLSQRAAGENGARSCPPLRVRYANEMLGLLSGIDRMRWPVAAKYALSTAGAAIQIVGSPTPPQKPPDGMRIVSTLGISAIRMMS